MLQIAKILKSNGTDGGLLIGLHDIDASEIDLEEPVYITFDGLPVPFFILDITPKGTSKAIITSTTSAISKMPKRSSGGICRSTPSGRKKPTTTSPAGRSGTAAANSES